MADVTSTTPVALRSQVQRIIAVLFLAQGLYSGATIANATIVSIAVVEISGNLALLGVPVTLGLLGRAVFSFPLGWLTDKVGRRRGLAVGFLTSSLGALLAFAAVVQQSLPMFLVATFLMGMGRASQDQSRYAAAEVSTPDRRAKAISLIVFAGVIGALIGPVLIESSNNLADSIGVGSLAGPLLLGSVLTVLASLTLFTMLRPDPMIIGWQILHDVGVEPEVPHETTLERSRRLIAKPGVRLAVTSMLVSQTVMVMLMAIMPVHMSLNDYTTGTISWVIMAHTLGMFGPSIFTGWLIERFGRLPLMASGALILISSAMLAPTSVGLPILLVSMFLLGAGWNFCYIAGSSLFADSLGATGRGRSQGLAEAASSSGAAGGSLISGSLFLRGDIVPAAALGLTLSVALIAYVAWFGWRARPGAGLPVPVTDASAPR